MAIADDDDKPSTGESFLGPKGSKKRNALQIGIALLGLLFAYLLWRSSRGGGGGASAAAPAAGGGYTYPVTGPGSYGGTVGGDGSAAGPGAGVDTSGIADALGNLGDATSAGFSQIAAADSSGFSQIATQEALQTKKLGTVNRTLKKVQRTEKQQQKTIARENKTIKRQTKAIQSLRHQIKGHPATHTGPSSGHAGATHTGPSSAKPKPKPKPHHH